MKKIIIVSILLTTLLFAPVTIADPTVIIESYELYPSVFMPGDSGILTLHIKNSELTNTKQETEVTGSTTTTTTDTIGASINKIFIESDEDANDKEVKATSTYENVGSLAPATSISTEFRIVADTNITEGEYFVTARVDVQTYKDVRQPIRIKVSNATVDLLATNVPSRISLSGSTMITLTAVNNRENKVDAVTIVPLDLNGIDFTPNSAYIGSLDPYESSDASFSVKPDEIGETTLSFMVYFNNGDNPHKNSLTFPIEIIENLDVAPVFISIPESIEKGRSSRVNLEVYNAKSESISGVIVIPITEAKVSPSQYFIGSMDAGDVFSATFEVSSGSLDYGNYSIGFKVSFKQENDYYETSVISSTFSVVQQSAISRDFPLFFTVALIVIIILILFFVFYISKKRRINK